MRASSVDLVVVIEKRIRSASGTGSVAVERPAACWSVKIIRIAFAPSVLRRIAGRPASTLRFQT